MVEKKNIIDPFPNGGIEKFRLLGDAQKEEMFDIMKGCAWKYLPEEYKQECRNFDEQKRQEKQRQELQALEEQKARESLIQEENRKKKQKQEEQERIATLAREKLDNERLEREREESERRNRLQEQERARSRLAYQEQETRIQNSLKRQQRVGILTHGIGKGASLLIGGSIGFLPIAIPIYGVYYVFSHFSEIMRSLFRAVW